MDGWIGSGAALAVALALLVAARRWLHAGLTPERMPTVAPVPDPDRPAPRRVEWEGPNGKRLFAWWLAAERVADAPARAAVLMHGWGGHGLQWWAAAQRLHAQGWSVLLPDARGHGDSEADSHSSMPRFAQDLASALDWVTAQQPDTAGNQVVVGHSVGAAAALLCATWRAELAAVVAISSFDHPEAVMRRWLHARLIPYWPLGWVVNRYVEWVIGHRFNQIAPVHTIRRVGCPVLLIHGDRDDLVPHEAMQALQAARPDATGWLLAGDHQGFDDESHLQDSVLAWLHNVTSSGSPQHTWP